MIKALIYDMMFGLPVSISTPQLYRSFLGHIPAGSKVLEIGVGTGLTIALNSDLIKEKQITITGIDIDKSYASLCRSRIKRKKLDKLVEVKIGNILEMQLKTSSYDYVLFMESYPVINKQAIELIVGKLRYIVRPKGRICFVHNLVEKSEWSIAKSIAKSNLRKFTTVEFGRLVERTSYEKWCMDRGLQLDFMRVIGEVNVPLPGLHPIRQYMYFWKPGVQT